MRVSHRYKKILCQILLGEKSDKSFHKETESERKTNRERERERLEEHKQALFFVLVFY